MESSEHKGAGLPANLHLQANLWQGDFFILFFLNETSRAIISQILILVTPQIKMITTAQ